MININRFINNLKCISMVIVLVLFTSCELVLNSFDKPVKEFFLENTSTASINHHVINCETFINPITNAVTISSETDATVVFYMRNPQGFIFTNGSNIILKNDKLSPLPTIEQNLVDKSVLYLKLPKDSLKQFEIDSVTNGSNKTLDFLIELKHPISNVDFQSYSFSIDCNSIPPTIFSPVYYKNNSNFVMAFNMPKKSDVMSIHNDLKKLIINGKEYSIDIAGDGTITFPQNPEIKSGDVKEKEADGIQKIKAEFITLEDYQPFYFETEVGLNQKDTSATLSLMDTANFTSTVLIRSNSNTLGSATLHINDQLITNKNVVIEQENDNNAKFTIIAPSHSIDSEGNLENVSGVSVKYTLTNIRTNEVITGSNNGSGSVTIDVPIGTYKLECISHKDYYADSITTFETIQIKGSNFNLYVSSDGDDAKADGSNTKPFKTIKAALIAINERNNNSPSSGTDPYKLILLTDIYESNINIAPDSNLYLTIKSFDNNYTIDAQEKGKVMTIKNNAFVTLENVTLTNGLSEYNAGGVEVYGSLTLSDNCIISSNTVTSYGYGAGIYLKSNAELTMNGGKITENTSDDYSSFGGGVYLEDNAKFVMNDGEISQNSVSNGGGVYVSGGTFEMKGGSISNNTADKNGGGVYVSGGTFKMNGGSISNNTVTDYGSGVYVVKSNGINSLFEISGNAYIEDNNDVYLTADQKITITGELTSNPVATITPEKYEQNVKVLAAGDVNTLKTQVKKFNVTETDFFTSEITEEGCLKITLEAAKLTAELYEKYSTIKVSSADGMNAISNLSGNEGKDFAGKTIILEDNIELGSDYKLIKTFSGVFEGNNHTIKLNKPDDYDYFEYLGGAIFNKITGNDAKVRNLNVSGEAYIAGIAIELENDAVISNCTNSAKITSPNNAAVPGCGGIVGELSNGGVIKNCKNEGTISYNSTNDKGCGGIVGVIGSFNSDAGNSIIANCINNGEIIRVQIEGGVDQDASIGGICGEVEGNAAIYNCVNTGLVTSEVELTDPNDTENIGGITGYCSVSFYITEFTSLPDDMGIFNCYNSGEISSSSSSNLKSIGGIVGKGYVYFSNIYNVYHTIRVTNTVNNDETTFAFGNITLADSSTYYDIKNNFYKKGGGSPINSLYEKSFVLNIANFITILNEYSDNSGRKYLEWKEDNGNIIFSKEISDNQGIIP